MAPEQQATPKPKRRKRKPRPPLAIIKERARKEAFAAIEITRLREGRARAVASLPPLDACEGYE